MAGITQGRLVVPAIQGQPEYGALEAMGDDMHPSAPSASQREIRIIEHRVLGEDV